ncbi:Pls/PosA family non-ribosomal peptide synthetase [Amycolatopsis anabasis]|uniref:Pls/PosA family non-ribosomal peptide synthetase n=1 Tax=Amycolatopsis anabasis TaxID=1840409 RepID=UPI00131C8D92|nr:Pls/PosA family non-ribosomal peptide synthetase [Amycolatopsis anabasis]
MTEVTSDAGSPGSGVLTAESAETDSADTPRVAVLPQYFENTCDRRPDAVGVLCGDAQLTYAQLDRRANRLANLLVERGIRPGEPVGILLERSLDTYVALLGVLKSGAAYVPLDPSFPADRLAFIATDAGLRDLVTTSASRERVAGLGCPVLELDQADLDAQSADRPRRGIDPEAPCYVIYTSGSTGKPKGVAISHHSIVNFLRVATPIYGVTAEDRVYQGMSISFDFHLEEMWPAWVAGATLVAGPTDARRFGEGLTDFLTEHRITVFCSVPTLLTTIENDPPSVRCLLVSGEPMPEDLVRRWSRPGRRILNCYGPTETTVSSSCCELLPDRPVTLGTPFPTYRFYVLDEELREVPPGGTGEICIGGPGVAIGYLNRPELTAERFVPNPVERDRAEVPRVYRTGDLGRCTSTGEYEYLGRMDTQVKIRGYRIELGEIEQAIREDHEVENAVVTTVENDGVVQDLVGYVTLMPNGNGNGDGHTNGNGNGNGNGDRHGALRDRLHSSLRRRLAPYMVPSFIEVLEKFPLLAADKVNRAALPAPTSPPLGSGSGPHVPAETPLENDLAEVWSELLGIAEVSVEADFFCDLGGHSLAAARVISQLRKRPGMSGLAMGDLYAHPTIRDLADYVEHELAEEEEQAESTEWPEPLRHSTARFRACGAVQLFLLYSWLLLLGLPALVLGYAIQLKIHVWPIEVPETGVFSVLANIGLVPLAAICVAWFALTLFLLPIIGARALMRGIRPGWHPMWGATYLRFWFYARIVSLAPVTLLTSTPLLPRYLRLLGARIGRDCHIATQFIGLPKFVEIGDGTSLGVLSRVQPYVVQDGWLRIEPIRIGSGCFVGASSVVLAGAELGDNAAVGHQSLVHADQTIPAGEYWAGSPSKRLRTRPALLQAMAERPDDGRWRFSVVLGYLGGALLLRLLPFLLPIPGLLLVLWGAKTGGIGLALGSVALAGPLQVFLTCVLLVGGKRLVLNSVDPGIYPWRSGFGVRQWFTGHLLQMTFGMLATVYCTLYAIPFLRGLGMKLGRWAEVAPPAYLDPDMCVVGSKSFLAGGVVLAPPVYHHGQIAVAPAEMADFSFLGNEALLPCGSRISQNSLLGVLSVPPEKPVDPETTWLGSPSFFLPRREESQKFPAKYIDAPTPALIGGRLLIEFVRMALPEIILLLGGTLGFLAMAGLATVLPAWALVLLIPLLWWGMGLFDTCQVILLKWAVMGRYRPRTEPYWGLWVRGTEFITGMFQTVAARGFLAQFWGTPFAAPVMRLFGTRVGKRVWLNDTAMTEFDLVEIGDDAMIGENADLQTHLFEDRVMKMSLVKVEDGATVGTRAVVLYDAEVGPGAYLDAYSLVMKGEVLPGNSRWRGIPARPL